MDDMAAILRRIADKADELPCTRPGGYYCRIHYDSDLCPPCAVMLELDRAHRDITGQWMHEVSQLGE